MKKKYFLICTVFKKAMSKKKRSLTHVVPGIDYVYDMESRSYITQRLHKRVKTRKTWQNKKLFCFEPCKTLGQS